MSNDPDTPANEHPDDDSPVIRELREKAKRAEADAARAEAAERQLALHKAGLGDLTDKQMKALSAAHDGDWDAESLKATATELNLVKPEGQQPEPPKIPAEELAAHQRVANAANGEPPAPPPDISQQIAETKSADELVRLLEGHGMLAQQD